jgi:hypothetical protein
MVFCGNGTMERLFVHPMDDLNSQHYIDLTMSKDDATFLVTCCCDEEWFYEFEYNKSDYERIKFNIMETIFESDTMEELIDVLDEIFLDGFEELIVDCSADAAYYDQCCEDCDGCPKEYLN